MLIMRVTLCGAILSFFLVFNLQKSIADVVIDGMAWRQVTETTGFSWNDLDVIYDTDTGMLDPTAGTTFVDTTDFSGWSWASVGEVATMFTASHEELTISPLTWESQVNSAWAPAFLLDFHPTYSSIDQQFIYGLTRDSHPVNPDLRAIAAYIQDLSSATQPDSASTVQQFNKTDTHSQAGAWLYKTATVPEPSLPLLLGISLAGFVVVGVSRKIRQKAVVKVKT